MQLIRIKIASLLFFKPGQGKLKLLMQFHSQSTWVCFQTVAECRRSLYSLHLDTQLVSGSYCVLKNMDQNGLINTGLYLQYIVRLKR